jgi:hypothetical protein
MATLADIAKASRAKPRAVQLWADAGAIRAEPETDRAGSGRHRLFTRNEVIIARVLAPFAEEKIAIGGLIEIGRVVRGLLYSPSPYRAAFDNAVKGKGKNYLVVSPAKTFTISSLDSTITANMLMMILDLAKDAELVKIVSLNACLQGLDDESVSEGVGRRKRA